MQYSRALAPSFCDSLCSALINDQRHPQTGHKMTAVFPGVTFRYNHVQRNRGDSFFQKIVNTYFTGPCRSSFTSHWLELGNMPISKPIIDNEMELLGFIETKRSLPLDLRLMWEGLYLNKQYWASAGSEGSERMLSR